MKIHLKYILFAFAIIVYSCKDNNDSLIISEYNYFPLDSGSYIIYQCDSLVHTDYDDNAVPLTDSIIQFRFQLMEVIDSSFIDGEGVKAFRINRYKRLHDSLPWVFQNIWVAQLKFNSAQRVEDNVRFIKLQFPINKQAIWNGNAYNSYQVEDYLYTDIHTSKQINNLYFDSTVTVIQNDFSSIINRIFKQEQYANHTGLIFKQTDSLTLTTFTGQLVPLNGFEYSQTIIEKGHF